MIKEGKLIFDNNAHKFSITTDGKQIKMAIAPFNEMSLTEANYNVKQINELINAGYSFSQFLSLYDTAINFSGVAHYSLKAVTIAAKLSYQDELQKYINEKSDERVDKVTHKAIVILNIGCTSAGKTLGNLFALIPKKEYVKNFISLTSIKESTNFPIHYIVNPNYNVIESIEEFAVKCSLKTPESIKEDVNELVLEAIQEILDTIKSEVKSNPNASDKCIWDTALNAGCLRLRINKDKTFDITNYVEFIYECEILEKILINSLRNHSTKSSSYNDKLSNLQIKEDMIKDFKNNIFELNIDDIAYIICTLDEFKDLVSNIYEQLQKLIERFIQKYNIDINEEHKFCIKKKYKDDNVKDLICNIFGDKKQRKDKEFFSIDALLSNATLYFKNSRINNGEQLTIVDGLGINQGQIAKGTEKAVAYNRVHSAIQQCNPDIILYNTRLDSKDDYIIDVIKDLNEQGYRNRVFVIYGRIDTILEDYCDDEEIDISEMTEVQFADFENYIDTQYLSKELISLGNMEREKFFLCDKPCKLSKYSLEYYDKYTPYNVIQEVTAIFKETHNKEVAELNKAKVKEIINIMDECLIFNNTFINFKNSIDEMVPMEYSLLRWNTLECAIRNLYNDWLGYGSLYPSITLKNCFAQLLNCDRLKDILGEDYDNILKELLNQWTNIAHILLVTSYKYDLGILLAMRYDDNLRTMKSCTLTNERKYIMRNILHTCFENTVFNGSGVFREITKHVLLNLVK